MKIFWRRTNFFHYKQNNKNMEKAFCLQLKARKRWQFLYLKTLEMAKQNFN